MSDKHTHPKTDDLCVYFIPVDMGMPMTFRVIGNTWMSLKDLIGGYSEMLPDRLSSTPTLPCGCRMILLADEDGLMKRLPENQRAAILSRTPIVGDVVLVGVGPLVGGGWPDMFSLPQSIAGWSGPGHDLPYEKAPWEK